MALQNLATWLVQGLRPRRKLEPSGSPSESSLLDLLEEIITRGDAPPRAVLGAAVNLGNLLAVRYLTDSSSGGAPRKIHVRASVMIDEGDLDEVEVRELISLTRTALGEPS